MKALIAIALAGCCIFGGVLALAADNESTSKPSELDTLLRQVADLEARVSALESRLQPGPHLLDKSMPRPWLHGHPVPENWSRREFNGMPYYVVPLHNDPNRTP